MLIGPRARVTGFCSTKVGCAREKKDAQSTDLSSLSFAIGSLHICTMAICDGEESHCLLGSAVDVAVYGGWNVSMPSGAMF